MTSRGDRNNDKEELMKHPIQRLFGASLMLLGCVIALSLVAELLAHVWPWLLGIALLVLSGWAAIRWATARRRQW